MIKETLRIKDHIWALSLGDTNEISFSFRKVIPNDEDPNMWDDWDGEWRDYLVLWTSGDGDLPEGLNAVSVMRHIIHRAKSLINRLGLKYFYFRGATRRKTQFYVNLIRRYIPNIDDEWDIQILLDDGSENNHDYFYFYRK